MLTQIQTYAKAIVAFVGAILTAGSTFIPTDYQPYISFGLAILTFIATYQVTNAVPTSGDHDASVASPEPQTDVPL